MRRPAEPAKLVDALNAGAILLLGVVSFAAGSGILEQWQRSSARQQAVHPEHLIGAIAAAGGAVLVCWWFLAFVLAGVTALLERSGRTRGAAVTRKLTPAFMQRLVLAALSFQLLSGPAAHAGMMLPGPEWTPTQARIPSIPASADPRPVKELLEDPVVPPADFAPSWQPAAPIASPGLLSAPAVRAAGDGDIEGGAVTVLAGDSLWDIAANAIGPEASDVEIALYWPRWYEANRGIIGPNPGLLLPGQILHRPPAA